MPTSSFSSSSVGLRKEDEWLDRFNFEAFSRDIRELGKKLDTEQGIEDVQHLNKMIRWSNSFAAIGLLTMGLYVNPISILGLSLYTFSRWAMIAHHTCHGGYEKCHPQNKGRWSRFKFGLGTLWRRFNDWFDWMMPEAWNVEHNTRHHYNLSEITDPDLVEQNLAFLRTMSIPLVFKYMTVGFFMMTWKWFYYAPNTYKELKLARLRREGIAIPDHVHPEEPITFKDCLVGENHFYSMFELISVALGPYFIIHFFVVPLPWLAIGTFYGMGSTWYWNAVMNLAIAELVTNVHAFIAIVTNHAGDDMYRFRHPCRPFSGSFYLRQVLASVDFSMGNDSVDFMHGWLNYQIEHHLWPNLSMLSYQKSAPQVQDICHRYGVPYIKQNVFWRLKKTVDIMVGNTTMPWFPEKFEDEYLAKDTAAELAAMKKSE